MGACGCSGRHGVAALNVVAERQSRGSGSRVIGATSSAGDETTGATSAERCTGEQKYELTSLDLGKEVSPVAGDNLTAAAVGNARARADRFLTEFRALEAESSLLAAGLGEDSFDPKLIRLLQAYGRVGEFALAGNTGMKWERVHLDTTPGKSSIMEICWESGATCGWMRQILEIPAPLGCCILPADQLDFWMDWNKEVAKNPDAIGPQLRLRKITHIMLSLLMGLVKVDAVAEVLRFPNHAAGFLAECIETVDEKTPELAPLPESPKGYKRVKSATYNLWMPVASVDKSDATLLIQVNRIEVGFSVPTYILKQVFGLIAPRMMKQFRESAKLAQKPGKHRDRMQQDPDGFYGELSKLIEAARSSPHVAADGSSVGVSKLPPVSMFKQRLPFDFDL